MGHSNKKPCPACKEFKYGRLTDDICEQCKALIKKARAMDDEIRKQSLSGDCVVSFGEYSHYNEYVYLRSHDGQKIRDAFHAIVKAVAAGKSIKSYNADALPMMGKCDSYSRLYAILPVDLANALADFYKLLSPAFELEYLQGKSDGRNLLMQLAQGEIAPNDFLEN